MPLPDDITEEDLVAVWRGGYDTARERGPEAPAPACPWGSYTHAGQLRARAWWNGFYHWRTQHAEVRTSPGDHDPHQR